ncbi:adenosine 5'-monophosphoramidase HINT3-like [Ornithodoros turicata]
MEGPDTLSGSHSCIFCRIVRREDPKTVVLFQDEDHVVFRDIHPAAKHHYLVIPKRHIKDPKCLTHSDIPLVQRLVEVGKQVLQQQGGAVDSLRVGFHWPPFNSIAHLHLHVISPVEELSYIGKFVYMPGSLWFCTAEDTLAYLEKMGPTA